MKEVEPLINVRHLILTDKLVHCSGADPYDLAASRAVKTVFSIVNLHIIKNTISI